MTFLCIGYFDPSKMDALPPDRLQEIMAPCDLHMENLQRATTIPFLAGVDTDQRFVHRAGNEIAITAESEPPTKKIGCIFVIEAAHIEEAAQLASLHPTTQVPAGGSLGWHLEIRPVHTLQVSGIVKSVEE